MPKGVSKKNLPSKVCVTCGLPFSWRKKWVRDWAEVKYCSERCKRGNQQSVAPNKADD